MNIIITRALNMEFEEKDLAAKVFHGKKDKLLYILELSYKEMTGFIGCQNFSFEML